MGNAREDVGPRGAAVTSDTLKYRLQGLELGVAGKVTERLSMFGGANFMKSKILENQDSDALGLSIANVAHTRHYNIDDVVWWLSRSYAHFDGSFEKRLREIAQANTIKLEAA